IPHGCASWVIDWAGRCCSPTAWTGAPEKSLLPTPASSRSSKSFAVSKMGSGWAGVPCTTGPTARSACTRFIACWASRCFNTYTARRRWHGPASRWNSYWRSCARSRNLFSFTRRKVTRDHTESPQCSPSKRCPNWPWPKRWGWNTSVLPRVGNTTTGSQPIPKTTTYTFVPALLSKLPLAYFGYSVSVSGNTAVIGAVGQNQGRGAAYVYAQSGGAWSLQQGLLASDAAVGDQFGC